MSGPQHMPATSFAKLIFVARKALLAYLIISAPDGVVSTHGAAIPSYSSRSARSPASPQVPATIRAGTAQSSSALPWLRNSGLYAKRSRSPGYVSASTALVPGGTVDFSTTQGAGSSCRTSSSTDVTCVRSADPSAAGGVPTVTSTMSNGVRRWVSVTEPEKASRPVAWAAASCSGSPGSKTGARPASRTRSRSGSCSTPVT